MSYQWLGVEDVLRFAHKWEAASLIRSPSMQRSSKGGDPNAMHPLDNVAQAALILSMMRRTLPHRAIFTIRLYFIIPADHALHRQKEELVADTAQWLHRSTGRPKWWIADTLRVWSGGTPEHDYKWWCKHLNVHASTLSRWARARNDTAICSIVEKELQGAMAALYDPMRDAGLLL